MPTCGNPAAITALPQPANVSQNVPMASATYLREFMRFLPLDAAVSRICRAGRDNYVPTHRPLSVPQRRSALLLSQAPPPWHT